ncbi:MAG: alpha/beta hydrolase [Planctomycetes bacterium]|nr:alpha/beta hydrolase [Planctomycetota bacterium]
MMEMETSRSPRAWWRTAARWIVGIVLAYLLGSALIAGCQRRFIYYPDARDAPKPTGEPFRDLEDVTLTTEDGLRLRAWYWPGSRPITLVIFHGNAGSRVHRLEWVRDLHDRGLSIFLLDYRGYGGSEGSPSEKGLYRDAEAAVRWLEERGAQQLVYVGESLGTGVAVELAVRRPPAALILQSGFSSLVDVGRTHFGIFPVSLFLRDRYENLRKIDRVECPLLMIHGERDTIVPVELGRRLFDAAREPKEIYLLPAADHNDLIFLGGAEYLDRVDDFLRRHLGE